jgi:hypothetical protein
MLKQNERTTNMANESAKSLDEARKVINRLDKNNSPFSKRVSLTDEEFRLIRSLLRSEYEKYELEYNRYSQPHTLSILTLIENTRRKFKLIQQ